MKPTLVLLLSLFFGCFASAQAQDPNERLLFTPGQPTPPEQPCVTLSNKKILCGSADTTESQLLSVFKGVQYGKAERWMASEVFDAYEPNGFEALDYGARCPQPIYKVDAPIRGLEDCLYLNIWAPDGAIENLSKLPVMVFFHGGGFVAGGSNYSYTTPDGEIIDLYNGGPFAADQNIVLVTVNSRIGILGTLFTQGTTGQTPENGGNYGMGDQQTALKWVQKHITSFGGDPAQVTIFGESSGAMAVGLHLYSAPSSQDLFRAAIMQSNPMNYPYRTKEEGESLFHLYMKCLRAVRRNADANDCALTAQLDDLKEATTREILLAQHLLEADTLRKGVLRSALPGSILFSPIIDGSFLVDQPMKGFGKGSDKPVLFGFNKDEGVLFANYVDDAGRLNAVSYKAALLRNFEDPMLVADRMGYEPKTPAAHGLRKNSPATALSNLIGNYMFACGNMAANIDAPEPSKNSWLYYFTPTSVATFLSPPKTKGLNMVCAPENQWGNSCHGSELPFVFNTMPAASSGEDQELAFRMNTLWAQFAKTPEAGPEKGWKTWIWPSFGSPLNVNVLQGTEETASYEDLFEASDCTFWLGEVVQKNVNAAIIPPQIPELDAQNSAPKN